jgi:GT2 family glycosyltransferase
MKTSVVIPTYRRPDMLRQAVASLFAGTRHPDEVIVVGRQCDSETVAAVVEMQATYGECLRSAWVTVPGHIPPVETGIKAASGEIVAIIDDDVTVTETWLTNILYHFNDRQVGVVGGRTILPGYTLPRIKGKPGRITWYGKLWAHLTDVDGSYAFEVDTVKECNWAWRREIATTLMFDPVLDFDSAMNYGVDLTLQAKKRGLKVLYDPQAVVYHHLAPRVPELDRANKFRRMFASCRNYTYIMLKHLPWWRKVAFLCWWFMIGGRRPLGVGTLMLGVLLHGWNEWYRFAVATAARAEGIRLWLHFCASQRIQDKG